MDVKLLYAYGKIVFSRAMFFLWEMHERVGVALRVFYGKTSCSSFVSCFYAFCLRFILKVCDLFILLHPYKVKRLTNIYLHYGQ